MTEAVFLPAEWSDLVISHDVRDWCRYPYPNHPHGCPNYDHADRCPPRSLMLDEYFDTAKPVGFVYATFDLAAHVERMRQKHPNWSQRQLRCVLYWQGGARSRLKKATIKYMDQKGFPDYTACPEGMGLNLFRTFHGFGIKLIKDPQDIVYLINMVGHRRK